MSLSKMRDKINAERDEVIIDKLIARFFRKQDKAKRERLKNPPKQKKKEKKREKEREEIKEEPKVMYTRSGNHHSSNVKYTRSGNHHISHHFYEDSEEPPELLYGRNKSQSTLKSTTSTSNSQNLRQQENHRNRMIVVREMKRRTMILSTIASLFYAVGNFRAAEKVYIFYLELVESNYGINCLEMSNCYYLIGVFYLENNYLKKAITCFRRSSEIRKDKLGPEHLTVSDCYYNMAIGYCMAQKLDFAKRIAHDCLGMRLNQKGENCLSTAKVFELLGRIHREMKDYETAIQRYEKSLKIMQNVFFDEDNEHIKRVGLKIKVLQSRIQARIQRQALHIQDRRNSLNKDFYKFLKEKEIERIVMQSIREREEVTNMDPKVLKELKHLMDKRKEVKDFRLKKPGRSRSGTPRNLRLESPLKPKKKKNSGLNDSSQSSSQDTERLFNKHKIKLNQPILDVINSASQSSMFDKSIPSNSGVNSRKTSNLHSPRRGKDIMRQSSVFHVDDFSAKRPIIHMNDMDYRDTTVFDLINRTNSVNPFAIKDTAEIKENKPPALRNQKLLDDQGVRYVPNLPRVARSGASTPLSGSTLYKARFDENDEEFDRDLDTQALSAEDAIYEINECGMAFRESLDPDQRMELTKLVDLVFNKSVLDEMYKPFEDVIKSAFYKGLNGEQKREFIEHNRRVFKDEIF